jgi:hypothetical protein
MGAFLVTVFVVRLTMAISMAAMYILLMVFDMPKLILLPFL